VTILIATGLRREARLMAGPGIVAIAGGGGSVRLEQGLEQAIAEHRVRALLSSGLAGALVPGLRPGAILIGDDGDSRLISALRLVLPDALPRRHRSGRSIRSICKRGPMQWIWSRMWWHASRRGMGCLMQRCA
jgi:hypothetical protein